MRKKLIAGNWKMNGSRTTVTELASAVGRGVPVGTKTDVVVFPAAIHLQAVTDILAGTSVAVGAQNIYPAQSGAFTGEISIPMVADFGCRYVLVGHSERRQLFAESDILVAAKCLAVQKAGLTPVLCVGETLQEREDVQTENIIRDQLASVMAAMGAVAFEHLVIAYEPVWAIGTGRTATPEQAQVVHAFIRHWLARHHQAAADKVRILYGGSVKAVGAGDILAMPDVDGALVGGASLSAEEFLAICNSAR